MRKNKAEFYKQWRIGFKYLFIVMLVCIGFRTLLLIVGGEGESITLFSVLLGLAIAFMGTAAVTLLIALYSTKDQ